MAITINALTRPSAGAPVAAHSGLRSAGLALAGVGLLLATVSFVNGLVAGGIAQQGGSASQIEALNAWSFGLTTAGFGTVKLGIGIDPRHRPLPAGSRAEGARRLSAAAGARAGLRAR